MQIIKLEIHCIVNQKSMRMRILVNSPHSERQSQLIVQAKLTEEPSFIPAKPSFEGKDTEWDVLIKFDHLIAVSSVVKKTSVDDFIPQRLKNNVYMILGDVASYIYLFLWE